MISVGAGFSADVRETMLHTIAKKEERKSNKVVEKSVLPKNNLRDVPQVRRQKRTRAQMGDVVTVDLELTPEGSFVPEPLFDTSGRVTFILGGGNYLPGLHSLVDGMHEGDSVSKVSIDAGWGQKNPDLIARVPKQLAGDKFQVNFDALQVGTQLDLKRMKVVVTEITDTDFVLDANPPMAGSSYNCSLTLIAVESPPTSFEYNTDENKEPCHSESKYCVASFGLGCFWGGELAFMREQGVVGTKVGYTQGIVADPTYEDVCSGRTKHTEAVLVMYDPKQVSYERLVELALEKALNDSYRVNAIMKGAQQQDGEDDDDDETIQYRHAIYYHTESQEETAERILARAGDKYEIEIRKAAIFYHAEDYHQQYLLKGGQSARKNEKTTIRCFG